MARSKPTFYYRSKDGYFCLICDVRFASYQAVTYHILRSKSPCIDNLRSTPTLESSTLDFDGERLSVPTIASIPGKEDFPENRDADGRLRISGTLTGYRSWSVGREAGEFRVFPLFRNSSVPFTKGVMTASCSVSRGRHIAPHLACSCGFYASWKFEDLNKFSGVSSRSLLSGRLRAFGKVLPGELGWRAQHVIIDGFERPMCGVVNCSNGAKKYIVRPDWYRPLSASGRVFPRSNSQQYATYRDTADFAGSNNSHAYLGWYCDQHEFADDLIEPYGEYQCNFPTQFDTRCKRRSTLALRTVPYSWCNEHAPFVFDAEQVIGALCNYYDVYCFDREGV